MLPCANTGPQAKPTICISIQPQARVSLGVHTTVSMQLEGGGHMLLLTMFQDVLAIIDGLG